MDKESVFFHRTVYAACICLFLSLCPLEVCAEEIIVGSDVEKIVGLASGIGPASLKQSQGTQYIIGMVDNINYTVVLTDCTTGTDCNGLLFHAVWQKKGISLKMVNRWNAEATVGRVFLDEESDPVLEMYVDLGVGMPVGNLRDFFLWWKSALILTSQKIHER